MAKESPNNQQEHVLVVDDDPILNRTLCNILKEDYTVDSAATGAEALEKASSHRFDLVLLDVFLPDADGVKILEDMLASNPRLTVMMVTGEKDRERAFKAGRIGAADFVEKPFRPRDLRYRIEKVLKDRQFKLADESRRLEISRWSFESVVGNSSPMQQVKALGQRMCRSDVNVLLLGESGTGKEVLARAIHYNSRRSQGPFVAINCACYEGNLLESELFGHERGAFTGAVKRRKGRFELAHQGTLFLDEIGNMPLATQTRLLRVLQDQRFERVGGETSIQVDVRILSATNTDIQACLASRQFREDLLYRLNVVTITMPPLRQRGPDEIRLLTEHFIEQHYLKTGKKFQISSEALEMLTDHHWPGNVRELENTISMCMALETGSVITDQYLRSQPWLSAPSGPSPAAPVEAKPAPGPADLKDARRQAERDLLLQALEAENGNKTRAAKRLGIHRNTLDNKLKRYNIQLPGSGLRQ